MHRLSHAVTAATSAASRSAVAAVTSQAQRSMAGPPPAPQKLECFIDGQKVLVDPGTTVLQVYVRI